MPIQLSKTLIKKLPTSEQNDALKVLKLKAGGNCFLCSSPLNEATDVIMADHDIPVSEGGPNTLSNLNLTHRECNSFKRNHPTVDVRPYLELQRKIKIKGGLVKYDEAIQILGINPRPIAMEFNPGEVTVKTADGHIQTYPEFSESNKEGEFRFIFARLGKRDIYNDDECQPRTIKPQHLWQIYNDINRNPLHEAPACRILRKDEDSDLYEAHMFDGQHKTLSFWIADREEIVMKIYLNITRDQAVRLVNSIQAKIKKLPLSPFELSAKMAEEWQERVDKYESEVGTENASEHGFVQWVEKDERTRAKSAFSDALYQQVLDREDLEFKKFILQPGAKALSSFQITETAFRNKILKPLLHVTPLKESFTEGQVIRDRESSTIVRVLNIFVSQALEPANGKNFSVQEETRLTRLKYQSALSFIAGILRFVVGYRLVSKEPRELLDKNPSANVWNALEQDVKRLLDHPIWSVDFDHSNKTKAVNAALSKNQDWERAFREVGLTTGYVLGADKLDPSMMD